jgi:LysR family hydrogen peroxide-inducible transcriptional activator
LVAGGTSTPCDGASIRFESGSFETLIRLVDAGLGMTILPELVVRALPPATRRARIRPFEGPTPVREVSFVRIREHLRREMADAIVDALLETLPEDLVVTNERVPRRQEVLAPFSA